MGRVLVPAGAVGGLDVLAADQGLLEFEIQVQGLEHLDRLGDDFGADAVTGENCDFHGSV